MIQQMIFHRLRQVLGREKPLTENYKIERKRVEYSHPFWLHAFSKVQDTTLSIKEHEIPIRLFFPNKLNKINKEAVIVFLHGGGFVTGSLKSYSQMCSYIARETNHKVIAVGYRLAPEFPFPKGLEDCYLAVKRIAAPKGTKKIILMGDSAGANLVLGVTLMNRRYNAFKISKQILLYPVLNNTYREDSIYPSVRENGENYLLTRERLEAYLNCYVSDRKLLKSPYVAPLLETDLRGYPKTLMITAEYDLLRDEGEAYAKKLRAAYNDVQMYRARGMLHGFMSLPPIVKEVHRTYKKIREFIGENK